MRIGDVIINSTNHGETRTISDLSLNDSDHRYMDQDVSNRSFLVGTNISLETTKFRLSLAKLIIFGEPAVL